jgi:hypothetical protein
MCSCKYLCLGKAISTTYSDSFSYTACNDLAPYCHLGPVRFCSIFPHFLINCSSFEEKLLNVNMCFDFLYKVCLKHTFAFPRQELLCKAPHYYEYTHIDCPLEILCKHWVSEESNCHALSTLYVHSFCRNKI